MKSGWKPAFPVTQVVEQYRNGDPMQDLMLSGGLTKRELFAAMAMQGRLGNKYSGLTSNGHTADEVAKLAVACADALLAELEKVTRINVSPLGETEIAADGNG